VTHYEFLYPFSQHRIRFKTNPSALLFAAKRSSCRADACAYFFTANAEAWRRFCVGLKIDPAALTAANTELRVMLGARDDTIAHMQRSWFWRVREWVRRGRKVRS